MRNKIFIMLLGCLLLGLSCDKNEDVPAGHDLLFQQDIFIPAGIGAFDVHHFQIKNIPTRYDQALELNGKKSEDISRVLTLQSTMAGVFGDADFAFIDQVSLRVFDASDPTDFVEIAYRYPMPLNPGNNLPLIPSLADSKRFFEKSHISLDLVLWLRNTTQTETDVRLSLQMRAAHK
ncbi:MAG: hypothetical protein KIS77_11560 [Saprospiraceae bacterium]|nr:hypothetical protein [Saprospiraceae bacterium]